MFHPNCTLPPPDVHIVAPTNLRGTLDILWASLATALACTYSLLYFQPRTAEHDDAEESMWIEVFVNIYHFCMTALACLVPEMVLMDAVQDWILAKRRLAELHKTMPSTRNTWNMRHMMFAGQSNFAVSYDEPGKPEPAEDQPPDQDGDVELQPGPDTDAAAQKSKPPTRHILRLAPQALFTALQEGLISPTRATTSEIKSRCHSNAWAKILTVFQITYFVLEITVRAIRQLPISQLELGVAGIVACSAVSYWFTIHKPGGATAPYPLVLHDYGVSGLSPRMQELCQHWNRDQHRNTIHLPSLRRRCTDPLTLTNTSGGTTKPSINSPFHGDPALAIAVFATTSLVLGAVHLAGWNYAFPSPVDATLWRSMAITTTAIPPFWLVMFAIIPSSVHDSFETWFDRSTKIVFAIYCLARVILIVEMGRCFFYLPPKAFLTSWVVNIPHIG